MVLPQAHSLLGSRMSIIRVELAPGFNLGDDVVLLAMDGDGVKDFAAALAAALEHGSGQLQRGGFDHHFLIRAGDSEVEVDGSRVVWRLDQAKASEVIADLDALLDGGRPGHQYVDISRPADTLVLSRDEYVRHP